MSKTARKQAKKVPARKTTPIAKAKAAIRKVVKAVTHSKPSTTKTPTKASARTVKPVTILRKGVVSHGAKHSATPLAKPAVKTVAVQARQARCGQARRRSQCLGKAHGRQTRRHEARRREARDGPGRCASPENRCCEDAGREGRCAARQACCPRPCCRRRRKDRQEGGEGAGGEARDQILCCQHP